jgi:hypothetical protein
VPSCWSQAFAPPLQSGVVGRYFISLVLPVGCSAHLVMTPPRLFGRRGPRKAETAARSSGNFILSPLGRRSHTHSSTAVAPAPAAVVDAHSIALDHTSTVSSDQDGRSPASSLSSATSPLRAASPPPPASALAMSAAMTTPPTPPTPTTNNTGRSSGWGDYGMRFDLVGEDAEDVPVAPLSTRALSPAGPGWAAHDAIVRALEDRLAAEGARAARRVADAEASKDAAVEARARFEADAADLATQLKDTRTRMGRRVRELEEELERECARTAADAARAASVHAQLAAEVRMLRAGTACGDLAPTGSLANSKGMMVMMDRETSVPGKVDMWDGRESDMEPKRAVSRCSPSSSAPTEEGLSSSSPHLSGASSPVSSAENSFISSSSAASKSYRNSSSRENGRNNAATRRASMSVMRSPAAAAAPPTAAHAQAHQPSQVNKDCAVAAAADQQYQQQNHHHYHPQQQQQHHHPSKAGGASVGIYRVSSSSKKNGGSMAGGAGQLPPRGMSTSFCPSTLSAMRVRSSTPPASHTALCSPSAAKQASVRSAMIAQLHSARYRNMRVAWYDVFQPEGTRLTAERFNAAVRALPGMPSDVHERELDALRGEMCAFPAGSSGLSGDDSVVTWAQFARFYQKTKAQAESGRP